MAKPVKAGGAKLKGLRKQREVTSEIYASQLPNGEVNGLL